MTHHYLTPIALLLAPLLAAGQARPTQATPPEFPQQQDAGDMLLACASSRLSRLGRERRRYCAGFVSGVEEATRLMQLSGEISIPMPDPMSNPTKGRGATRICTPKDISASELADVFVQYGANHKGELPDPAALVVLHALQAAFPCPRH